MALPLEDYAIVGDTHTAAVIGANGNVDWLCLPRFDSAACFAALLGTEEHGFWSLAPDAEVIRTSRRYRGPTLLLETDLHTADGSVRLIDFMPIRSDHPRLVRVVEGLRGSVDVHTTMRPRFDYGKTRPWVQRDGRVVIAQAGPSALELRSDVQLDGDSPEVSARFRVGAGERVAFVLTSFESWLPAPRPIDPITAEAEAETWWSQWAERSTYRGPWAAEVERSLVTLKALTYAPTGGIVAAATTSLPEFLGGVRNWDYRYCWMRDAALSLDALMAAGYVDEATSWRNWVLRAVAGDPEDLQIMYGIAGERRLEEFELPWLPGYEGSAPVRVGNAASGQLQLDVYGELVDAIYRARQLGMPTAPQATDIALDMAAWLEDNWQQPDDGIWEIRGPRQQFVHSKVMAWVAIDRMVTMAQDSGMEAPGLSKLRDEIHDEICDKGFDAERNTFTQYYGSKQLDAALLLIPQVGFLPPDDPRVVGTIEAVQRELVHDGFVMRYIPDEHAADGLPPGEGAFLACSFWLVEALAMIGRVDEARALFDRLLSLRNELGLYSEEYDQQNKRLIGNFPQAFTHLTLISAAVALQRAGAVDESG
ncbi:MAG: glycoside hydrolase family 15 protein [Actinomycetes bacterium]